MGSPVQVAVSCDKGGGQEGARVWHLSSRPCMALYFTRAKCVPVPLGLRNNDSMRERSDHQQVRSLHLPGSVWSWEPDTQSLARFSFINCWLTAGKMTFLFHFFFCHIFFHYFSKHSSIIFSHVFFKNK